MTQIKGLDIGIYAMKEQFPGEPEVYTLVGGGRGATLSMSAEGMDITSKDTGGWMDSISGFKSWESSTDGIVVIDDAGFEDLESAFFEGRKVKVSFKKPSGWGYTGMALVNSLEFEAGHEDVVTYSISLTGAGALTKTEDTVVV
ncbi:phage major tail protein, TP901-1 family [Planococcus sp. ANT_H30]|uniref:phage major tail protein, TP901-1 family n=1 Tax=Planococcus sp. ANT_H30 TaxID=2597347 RepID=UPI0011EC91BC|nr:phage major tail protein, TP901-1 family [Planococcus sp. ANT_H30]KAA0957694.1 phage major tail protein, TP901-1 family [Planococcus sp. ANT_H30]